MNIFSPQMEKQKSWDMKKSDHTTQFLTKLFPVSRFYMFDSSHDLTTKYFHKC